MPEAENQQQNHELTSVYRQLHAFQCCAFPFVALKIQEDCAVGSLVARLDTAILPVHCTTFWR